MSYQTFSYWGRSQFNYVLVTSSNPVTTCASDGQVNPYPNRAAAITAVFPIAAVLSCIIVPGTCTTASKHCYSLHSVHDSRRGVVKRGYAPLLGTNLM